MWTVDDGCDEDDDVPLNTRSGVRTHSEPTADCGDSNKSESLLRRSVGDGDLGDLIGVCCDEPQNMLSAVTV